MMPDGSKKPLEFFMGGMGGGTGFNGAQSLGKHQSYIVFPTLDTRKEVSSYSRTEMLRRVRWLYNNVGIARRFVLAMSRMMGTLQPSPNTPDAKFNREALDTYRRITGSPLLYERSGKFTADSYQHFLSRRWLIDGDMLTVFARTSAGNSMVVPYEGHQIGQLKNANEAWRDGVLSDEGMRAERYRVLHPDSADDYTDFEAATAHLTAFWERGGQARGVTPFASTITRMIDVRDLTTDMMDSIKKSHATFGLYLENPAPQTGLLGQALGDAAKQYMVDVDNNKDLIDVDVDGSPLNSTDNDTELNAILKWDVQDIIDGGAMPEMSNGAVPRVLHDDRPHPHQMELVRWFVREMALSFDLPPEIIWDIASLNGNTSRLLNEDTEQALKFYRNEILKPFCQRNWFHLIGTEIAEGRLDEPTTGRWDDVHWMHPKSKTIDRGRDGALNLEELRMPGMRTREAHFGELQQHWQNPAQQWFDEIDWFLEQAKERDWPPARVEAMLSQLLAAPAGSAPYPGSDEPAPEPPANQEPSTKNEEPPGLGEMLGA